jgi:hypothetical protein
VVTGGDSDKVYVVIVDIGAGIREKHLVKIFFTCLNA